MLAFLVRLVYNMYVSKKETKEYPMKVYEVQYQNGFSWLRVSSYGNERAALIGGEQIANQNPSRKHRMVLVENGRKSTIHMF